MKARDRAYRDIRIVLGRAGGATYPDLAREAGISERQAKRVVARYRESRRGAAIRKAYLVADLRRALLEKEIKSVIAATDEIEDAFLRLALLGQVVPWLRELREVEELLGLLPREVDWTFADGSDHWLWLTFRDVLQRHPEVGDDLYYELRTAFREWADIRRRSEL